MCKEFEVSINGITFRQDDFEEVLAEVSLTNKLEMRVEREPDNPYDTNAIKVIANGRHIGYVPATKSQVLAPLMDNGLELKCKCGELGHFTKTIKKTGQEKTLPYGRLTIEI